MLFYNQHVTKRLCGSLLILVIRYGEHKMVALQNNPKLELDNFFIKNFLQSPERKGKHLDLNADVLDKKTRTDEDKLQEWRRAMYTIRNVESDIGIH